MICLMGWLAWNVLLFVIEKDGYDDQEKEFPFKAYVKKRWDNWLASLVLVPVLLWLGSVGLGLNIFSPLETLEWSDTYYLLSGCASEMAITGIKKYMAKQRGL